MTQISKTVYSKELQKQLFPDNSFYKKSISETGLAADAATFEIPNLSDVNEAKEDEPTVLPLKVVQSTDDKKTGTMKELYCDPILIRNEEEFVMNYSKRQAKQIQQAASLNTKAADFAAYKWLPTLATNIVESTGAARATNVTGLTGNRKALLKADLLKVHNILMRMNILSLPGELYGLLTPDAYSDLLGIAEFIDYDKTGRSDKLAQGIIGRIAGIEMMVRSKNGHIGALFTAANAIVRSVTVAATNRPVSLFWHSGMVCHAEAHPISYINENDATYLGTVLNSSVRFGAEKCRTDEKGVIALAEVV
jgi:hypothetical protein